MNRIGYVLLVALLLVPVGLHAQPSAEETVEEAEARRDFEVRIAGNQVLLDPAILWIVDLPKEGPPDEQMAERAQRRLERFFEQTGYDLARVRAFAQGDVLWVFVDEGVLEEIYVVGASTTRTVNLRLELELPGNVYNRIHLERELGRLEDKYDLMGLEANLVRVGEPSETVVPLERFVAALESPHDDAVEMWLDDGARYSLEVVAHTREWGSGFDVGVSFLSPYGLRASGSYSNSDLLFEADRYSVGAELGVLSETLLTSAEAELFYGFPEQFGESVRPIIDAGVLLDSFEREGLSLENYRHLDANALLAVGWEPLYNLVLTPGVGYGWDRVFGFSRTDQTPDYIVDEQRDYFVGEIGLEWLIGRAGLRRDKLHLLEAVAQVRTVDTGSWWRLEGDYQRAWEYGYNDLFVRSNYFSFLGSGIEWFDEDPITSQVMRAVAGDQEFAPHLLAVGTEFRLGLHRDIVQAGVSASGAAAGLRDRQTRETYLEFFTAGGPGLHVQLLNNFQLNLFYHQGWRADGETDGRFSLRLWKIY